MENNLQDKYNEIYKSGKYTFYNEMNDIYAEVYSTISKEIGLGGAVVMDTGCGDGEFVQNYLKDAEYVVGIDFSEESIKLAKEKNIDNANFAVSTLEQCSISLKYLYRQRSWTKFNIVTAIGVIEHLDNPELLFQVAEKALKPGGILVIEHPNFLNLRGIIWKTLEIFVDAVMSKTDKHTLFPQQISKWINKYNFNLSSVKTFRHQHANGNKLIKDFDKRLRLALFESENGDFIGDQFFVNEKVDEFLKILKLYTDGTNKLWDNPLMGQEMIWKLVKK